MDNESYRKMAIELLQLIRDQPKGDIALLKGLAKKARELNYHDLAVIADSVALDFERDDSTRRR